MVLGWNTHEKLSCPYCMENNKAFTLLYGDKDSIFDYLWKFLPSHHWYKNNKKHFSEGKYKMDVVPLVLLSEELCDVIL
jgi:secreted PhoX family phosphatase